MGKGSRAEPVITKQAIKSLIDSPLARIANAQAGDPLGRGDVMGFLSALRECLVKLDAAIEAQMAAPEEAATLTTDYQRRVVALHAAGLTVVEIARETGGSRAYTDELLRSLHLVPNVKKSRIPDAKRKRVVALYKGGHGRKAIAEDTGLTDGQVKATLRWAGRQGIIEYGGKAA